MSDNFDLVRNRCLLAALMLLGLWAVSWVLMGLLGRGPEPLGIPLITWSHILLGLMAVVVSIYAAFVFDRWERRS